MVTRLDVSGYTAAVWMKQMATMPRRLLPDRQLLAAEIRFTALFPTLLRAHIRMLAGEGDPQAAGNAISELEG